MFFFPAFFFFFLEMASQFPHNGGAVAGAWHAFKSSIALHGHMGAHDSCALFVHPFITIGTEGVAGAEAAAELSPHSTCPHTPVQYCLRTHGHGGLTLGTTIFLCKEESRFLLAQEHCASIIVTDVGA